MAKTKRGRQTATTTTAPATPVTKATVPQTVPVEQTDAKISGRAQRRIEEEESKKKRIWWIVGGIAAALLVIGLGYLIFSDDDSGTEFPAIVPGNLYEIAADIPQSAQSVGNPDALVTLQEWGDYQCPGCGNFAKTAGPNIMEQYVNTGKIIFEFSNFPFIGPESLRAAEAASCAADQGKYWDYHDTIYVNQQGENVGALSDDRLAEMAEVNGMDVEAFKECLEADTYKSTIEDERQVGQQAGVDSTPTLIINGQPMAYRGWDDLKVALDAALAAAAA